MERGEEKTEGEGGGRLLGFRKKVDFSRNAGLLPNFAGAEWIREPGMI